MRLIDEVLISLLNTEHATQSVPTLPNLIPSIYVYDERLEVGTFLYIPKFQTEFVAFQRVETKSQSYIYSLLQKTTKKKK